jgi:hypothetical protein
LLSVPLCAVLIVGLAAPPARGQLPAAYDWRTEIAFPPIRDQGEFDTGWAFAAIGVFEIVLLREGIEVDLSEQYLISCENVPWAGTAALQCPNGISPPPPTTCGQYGAPLESDLPYQGTGVACQCSAAMAYCAEETGWIVDPYSPVVVDVIKQALLDYGPLYIMLYAGEAFRAYAGGVFNAPDDGPVNHGVILVGWDDNDGGGVWIVRNSMGPDWGEGGYMRIRYGCAQIGFVTRYIAGHQQATFRLSGTVYGAAYGCGSPTPLAGVAIQGLGVTTDANGEYSKSVGYNTNWCIAPQNGTYFFMEDCRHINGVQGDRRSDFTGYASQVSGRVTTAEGTGVPDVTISIQQGGGGAVSGTTDADGNYSIIVVWGAVCTATPTESDCTFDPPARELGETWECLTNQDFVATCAAPPVEEPKEPGDVPPADTSGDGTTTDGDTSGDATAPTDSNQPAGAEETQTGTWPLRCGNGACGAGLVAPWTLTVFTLLCLRRRFGGCRPG